MSGAVQAPEMRIDKVQNELAACVSACESFKQALHNTIVQREDLLAALSEARSHLYCAKVQRAESDDKIIAGHIDDSLLIVSAAIAKATQP